ncbi:GIY-YIG nuclease family protein [Cognatilysobacter segetis]|uniref:GIY-YIG nuclease family protein n=1 Tax=Cognatilysobacter segetis TaxID=2492394 RepID=UPI00105D4583|nr:GIY-YIG nuclease family protein [Lysobacter segetis]
MTSHPQTIQIFLPLGDPQGIRVAEITTRIVRVIEVPRSLLAEFLRMPEADQVGVYFLFGEDDDGPKAYIGQTGSLKTRLIQHNSAKSFWNRAVVAVSLTNSLTNTHATYLEWLSLQRAGQVGRYALDNGNTGARPHTPAPLQADCAEIHETLRVLLATLGHPLFEELSKKAERSAVGSAPAEDDIYRCIRRGAEARGQYTEEGFVVLKGSTGPLQTTPSYKHSAREKLLRQGAITVQGDQIRFERDVLFQTPSGAGDCVTGSATNGWLEWKRLGGQTLHDDVRAKAGEGQIPSD